jgi:hypothetical protein
MAEHLDDVVTIDDIKKTAKIIKNTLKTRFGVEIKHGWALEVSSATYGYKNWDTASAITKIKNADTVKSEVLSTQRGLISENDFNVITTMISKRHQTDRHDSFTRGMAIKKAAETVGVGEFLLFNIFYVTVGHDDLGVAVKSDGILGDFRTLTYKIQRDRRVDLLKSLDAPEEVLAAERVKERELSSIDFFGYAGKGIEIHCDRPSSFVNDLILRAMQSFYLTEKEREQAWKKFHKNKKAALEIAEVIEEITQEIGGGLFMVAHKDTTDYARILLVTEDLNAVENTKIEDFYTWIKSTKNGRKTLVPKFAKRIKTIVEQTLGIRIKSLEERLSDVIRHSETTTEINEPSHQTITEGVQK